MISMRARIARAVIRFKVRFGKTIPPIAELRAWTDRLGDRIPVAQDVRLQPVNIGGIHAEWVSPLGAPEDRVLLYLHGGGYALGSCRSHRGMVSAIARVAGMRALLPEYRLAPENPYPAALEDAVAAYRWLLDHGVEPRQIAIAGDSAGGGLALATLVALRDQGMALPGAAALISPWTDLAGTGQTLRTRRRQDPWLRPDNLGEAAGYYAGERDRHDPGLSPLFAELTDLPPLLIQVGDREILLSDSTRVADKIRESGGDVCLRVWPGMWHVWHAFFPFVPEARAAIVELTDFLQTRLSPQNDLRSAA